MEPAGLRRDVLDVEPPLVGRAWAAAGGLPDGVAVGQRVPTGFLAPMRDFRTDEAARDPVTSVM